jgi:type II secretory pathway pseudopilin PulG
MVDCPHNEKEKTMEPTTPRTARRAAFTIVELLTVMTIITILIGLLVPALNKVKQFATNVKETKQINSIDVAVELFNSEFGYYPESTAMDGTGLVSYCGAMKLAEAVMGQDLMGFHPNSTFRADGLDTTGMALYATGVANGIPNLSARKGPYLPPENANAVRLTDIYGTTIAPFVRNTSNLAPFVLCDVFSRQMAGGQKTGMPILYYKANTANTVHDYNSVSLLNSMAWNDSKGNIYNYRDNQELLGLGKPWAGGGTSSGTHLLYDPIRFGKNIKNEKVSTWTRPARADSYILISAGWDGEYGTADDVCNFEWKYRQ